MEVLSQVGRVLVQVMMEKCLQMLDRFSLLLSITGSEPLDSFTQEMTG